MKTFRMSKLLVLACVLGAVFLLGASTGYAGDDLFSFEDPNAHGTKVQEGIADITNWVYWIFYAVGGVLMGIGAFKLKQGDMGGFGKNMAGGATLFFIPAAIKLFRAIGDGAR